MAISWRQAAQRVIAPIEAEYKDRPYVDLRAALFKAYPFGTQSHTPYKVWRREQTLALARHPESPNRGPEYTQDLLSFKGENDGQE